jgi:two-component system chemotaxis sensor kinase CheA
MDHKKRRILVVDDDRSVRRMYGDFLRADDYDVVEESSAIDALERLIANEQFDLVITDVMMARMDGWEFLDRIRVGLGLNSLQLPVIVVSAHFDSDNLRKEALGRGASATYTKAEPLSKLVQEVRIHTGRMRSKFDDDTDPG